MTQPDERTTALGDARELLRSVYASEEPIMWSLVRTRAMMILRHYRRDEELSNRRRLCHTFGPRR
jgi:hypothetical protein